MKKPYLCDLHMHSLYSGDVDKTRGASIDALCARAVELGFDTIAVTDHLEIQQLLGFIFPPLDNDGIRRDVLAAQEKYAGKLHLLYGVELAQALHNLEKTNGLLAKYPYEFIIGSVHCIKYYEDFSDMKFAEVNDETLFRMWEKYLAEMQALVNWGNIDTLAHITYPFRYYKRNGREKILQLETHGREYFEPIFKTIIEKGIALEINTSGLRQGLGCTMPDLNLIRFYYEMGGRRITVGSDAHYACDLGKNIPDAFEMMRTVGFDSITVFDHRQPVAIQLD